MNPLPRRLFVTGTDTEVGKTVASAAFVLGLDACYWKPVQAGVDPSTDTESVARWTTLSAGRFIPETYRLTAPMSPHAAAEREGVEIRMDRILRTPLPEDRSVVIEGAGGLMVPLNDEALMIDLLEQLRVPAVLVARSGLGTLNHTLLSIGELRRRSIALVGVVMNGPEHESNRRAIERYGEVRVLGRLPELETIDRRSLLESFHGLSLDP